MTSIQQLIPKELQRGIELQKAVIAIFSNKLTGQILQKFQNDQFSENRYLKRIRQSIDDEQKVEFLIDFQDSINQESTKLIEEITEFELKEIDVPSYQPLTFEQRDLLNAYWPTSIRNLHTPILFDDQKQIQIQSFFQILEQQAEQSHIKGNKQNACLLTNTQWDQIILIQLDCTYNQSSSIRHCTMNIIDKFSELSRLNSKILGEQNETTLTDKEGITKSNDTLTQEIKSNPEFASISQKRTYADLQNEQYYLSNLDLFILQEPCIMCSMALVHSRINQVFYKYPNSSNQGGLNDKLCITFLSNINHKYKVFKVIS